MRILTTTFLPTILACGLAPAQGATIGQYVSGTISAVSSVDAGGAFSPPGTDLKGKRVRIYFQYNTQAFRPAMQCGPACALYFSKGSNGSAEDLRNPNTPSSVLISISLNGTSRTFAPFSQGTAEFFTLESAHSPAINAVNIGTDSVAPLSQTVPSCQVSVQYEAPTAFGHALSPSDNPVADPDADFDSFTVSVPATANSAAAVAKLTFVPDRSAW